MAGGLGKRLRPLTEKTPKPMVPVFGKPYLEYQLIWLKSQGIERILILTGYLGKKISLHFGDGSSLGVQIDYSQEPEALGTGGALKFAEKKLDSLFFLIYGDSFLPVDYQDLKNYFFYAGRKIVVVVYDNQNHDTSVANNISLGENRLIQKYKKNSKDEDLSFVEAGVLVLKKEILSLTHQNRKFSLEEELFPILIREKEMCGYISQKPFYDIGTAQRLVRFESFVRSESFFDLQ